MPAAPPLKLDIFVGFPSYGGNGGVASEHPDIREWWVETVLKMKADPRIGQVYPRTESDTPICMVRNKFVLQARAASAHLLLMVDSDQSPNKHKGEAWFKPFWDVAFDEIYNHYQKGPLVVGAPYCGPPGAGENVYVFQFENDGIRGDETPIRLEMYNRNEAARMTGVSPVAALPTGLILYDMRLFDLTEPSKFTHEQVLEQYHAGTMTKAQALSSLKGSWFHYEWKDCYQAEKASTEDVVSTRDLAFAASVQLGYNPLRCAWDSWIGHWKPWNVGKPGFYPVESAAANLRRSVELNLSNRENIVEMNCPEIAAMGKRFVPYVPEANGHGHVPTHDEMVERGLRQAPIRAAVERLAHGEEPATIKEHYWHLTPEAERRVIKRILELGAKTILDIGPGRYPFREATDFAGRKADGHPCPTKPFHELDLNSDPLPYADKSVDFVFCRHVLEDLDNPEHLLREINRVAKAGYIETPSPIAECCRGVEADNPNSAHRGYAHHRSVVWSAGDVLHLAPKVPAIESLQFDDKALVEELNQGPARWNTQHFWEGELKWHRHEHERDFSFSDNSYGLLMDGAIHTCRCQPLNRLESDGEMCPPEHREALAGLLKSVHAQCNRKLRVAEVGSWLGQSAIAMADTGIVDFVSCFDHWEGSKSDHTSAMAMGAGGPEGMFNRFCREVGDRLHKTIRPFRQRSPEAAASVPSRRYDLIYLDAAHDYESVKADIEAWLPKVADGGILCGHDYSTIQFPGVTQAVDEAFGGWATAVGDSGNGLIWYVNVDDVRERNEKGQPCLTRV